MMYAVIKESSSMQYHQEIFNIKLFTKEMKFSNYRPIEMDKYLKLVKESGKEFKGVIYEHCPVGQSVGWIGIESETGQTIVQGKFKSYLHQGNYDQLEEVFQNILSDFSKSQEFYLVYLNSPQEVSPSNLKTKILFR